MYNIILLALAASLVVAGMARRRRRKTNWNKYMSGTIDLDLEVGALAGLDLVGEALSETVVDSTRVSTIRATYSLAGWTLFVNSGPILVGVAHSNYSDPEIESFIEASGSWDQGGLVEREVRSRRIRFIGTFPTPEGGVGAASVLNDGKPITTKLNWNLSEGDTLRFWVYNTGSATINNAATPTVAIFGKANLWFA